MKNKITGRSAFLALLKDEGITHLFGNPGTTELPIMHALKDHPDLTYVMAMQESLVVAMAVLGPPAGGTRRGRGPPPVARGLDPAPRPEQRACDARHPYRARRQHDPAGVAEVRRTQPGLFRLSPSAAENPCKFVT